METGSMDLAMLAISNLNLSSDIGVAVLDKALETQEVSGEGLIKMMELSVNPQLGNNLDIKI